MNNTSDETVGSTTRQALGGVLDGILQPGRFKDYGPNGLQVEGRDSIGKLVSGVTASLALIEAAIESGADAILVHHGLFWRGQDGRVTGWMKRRLQLLLAHDINLFAYHLPLDAHPELGNNAQLARVLGLPADERCMHFGEQDLGWMCEVPPAPIHALVARIELALDRRAVMLAGDGRALRRVAWCTGGAQGYFEAAIAAGADVFITGEISEPQAHYARESGVAYIACGHHATERYGAPAVAAQAARQLGLMHEFIDVDNPA